MIPLTLSLSLLFLGLQTTFFGFSQLPVLAFAPFLAVIALCQPLSKTLYWSFFIGFLFDLLSYDPFGVYALSYTIASLIIFRWRFRFSLDAPLQYGFYTALFSSILTILQILMLFLFDRRVSFQGRWWIVDLPILAISDALYALIWFAGPLKIYRLLSRKWGIFWLQKQNNRLSQN